MKTNESLQLPRHINYVPGILNKILHHMVIVNRPTTKTDVSTNTRLHKIMIYRNSVELNYKHL